MTQSAYARYRATRGLRGQTQQAVSIAIKTGRIPVDEDGLIDPAVADELWSAPAPKRQTKRKASKGKRKEPRPTPQGHPLDPSEDEGYGPEVYARARTAKEVAQAKLASLKAAQEEGLLVPVADVEAAWSSTYQGIRTKLLTLPMRLAPLLVGETDEVVIRDMIEAEVRDALEGAADGASSNS